MDSSILIQSGAVYLSKVYLNDCLILCFSLMQSNLFRDERFNSDVFKETMFLVYVSLMGINAHLNKRR